MPFNPKRAWKRLQLRVWRRPEDDRDLADEVAFHLAEEERLRVEAGMPADEAHASARRDFGNVPRVIEITRSMRGLTALESVVQDLRFALRLLRRNRVFALFAIASLALGIGATTAIFSLFDAIVLRELPVREPGRLVTLSFAMSSNRPNNYMTYPHFARMRDGNQTLDGLFAWTRVARTSVGFQGREEVASSLRVSGEYYSTLALQPALGRLLTRDDDHAGSAAAVLSHGYWQRRFGGSPVVGASISVNQVPFTIVGVEPKGFAGVNVGLSSDVIIPLRAGERFGGGSAIWNDAFATWIEIMGRVRADVTIERATEDLKLIFAQVNASVAQAAPGNAFAARVSREARLIVTPGARGGLQRPSRGLRALASTAADDARGRGAARQPQCRHAAAVAVRGATGRNRHAAGDWRGALAHRATAHDRVAGDRRPQRRARPGPVVVDQPVSAARGARLGRRAAVRSHSGRAGVCVHRDRQCPDVGNVWPAAGAARDRRPAPFGGTRDRSAAAAMAGANARGHADGLVARTARVCRALRAQPAESVDAGSRIRPNERPHVLGRRRPRGQTRARPREHLPVTARVPPRAAWSNIGQRLGGGACQHEFLLRLERGAGGLDGIPRRSTSAYRVQ